MELRSHFAAGSECVSSSAPEIWQELIDPKIRCQGVLKSLTCFIDR